MTTPCTIQLRDQPFDPLEALAAWHRQLQVGLPGSDWDATTATPVAAPPGRDGNVSSRAAAATAADHGVDLPAAEAHFIGRVRGTTAAGKPLEALELEHYPGMTEAQLEQLARGCKEHHGAEAVLVLHRVGRIRPGEAIVLVAVMADRRGTAQRCGQDLLERLKHDAPFWKREWSGGEGSWVEGNTAW